MRITGLYHLYPKYLLASVSKSAITNFWQFFMEFVDTKKYRCYLFLNVGVKWLTHLRNPDCRNQLHATSERQRAAPEALPPLNVSIHLKFDQIGTSLLKICIDKVLLASPYLYLSLRLALTSLFTLVLLFTSTSNNCHSLHVFGQSHNIHKIFTTNSTKDY